MSSFQGRRVFWWPLARAGGILGRFENVRVKKSAKKTVTCDVGDQVSSRGSQMFKTVQVFCFIMAVMR